MQENITCVPSATLIGSSFPFDALSKQSASGPCGVIMLCKVAPPG